MKGIVHYYRQAIYFHLGLPNALFRIAINTVKLTKQHGKNRHLFSLAKLNKPKYWVTAVTYKLLLSPFFLFVPDADLRFSNILDSETLNGLIKRADKPSCQFCFFFCLFLIERVNHASTLKVSRSRGKLKAYGIKIGLFHWGY